MTWKALWSGLPVETREAAALAFWENGSLDSELVARAREDLAEAASLRARTVARLPLKKRAAHMARKGTPRSSVIAAALVSLHVLRRRPMLARFLDVLEVPNDGGVFTSEAALDELSPTTLKAASAILLDEYPPAEVDLYFEVMALRHPAAFAELPWIGRAARGLATTGEPEADPSALDGPEPPPAEAGAEDPHAATFTTLDHVVIRSVIDTVAEAEGALEEDQLEDLVDEIVHLNPRRHSSYFHRGFLDVLTGRELDLSFPESNPDRRAWTLAGGIHAAARRGDHALLLGMIEANAEAGRALTHDDHPAAAGVVPLVYHALLARGRIAELPTLLSNGAIARAGPRLWESILWEAGGLIRERRGPEAEPILDQFLGLLDGVDPGDAPAETYRQEALRRKAHCLRLRGDFAGAEAILRGLLDSGRGRKRAMVLADLGLLQARYRSLGDVRLPRDPAEFEAVAAALARGEEFFVRSVECEDARGGHGEFCLGTLNLARGAKAKALPWLERAVAEMQRHAKSYREVILPRAQLYLGACLAETLEPARAPHASDSILAGVEVLGEEALPLLKDAIEGLEMTAPAVAESFTRKLHAILGDRLLDPAIGSGLLSRVPELRRALAARAATATRPLEKRFADYETLLGIAREAGDEEAGEVALDGLEEISRRDGFAGRFLGLLEDPALAGFVLDHDDAVNLRVHILASTGRTKEAATALTLLAHEVLTRKDRPQWLVEAEDLVSMIARLGIEPEEQLRHRIEAERAHATADAAATAGAPSPKSGTILLVGGDERQAQYDDEILAHAATHWPEVQVVLKHPGWGSNWGRQLERWQHELEHANALVIMRFVRTVLGQSLRKICSEREIPWVACTGHGRESIQRAIAAAVSCL